MSNRIRPAVGYIRMSTGRQENSPERQRHEIQQLAKRENYRITRWYEDHGLTGTESANRPEFQTLLKDAQQHRFEAILVHEQSRFSREDIFDVMFHWRLLREAGVDIVTCQRGRLRFDDLGGIITAIIDQHGAREESAKLASRVVSGQRLRASQGKRIGGVVFAYDRELHDEHGRVVRRVSFREKFRKPVTWTSKLVPSDESEAVSGVKWMFDQIHSGQSVGHVVRGLNRRGLKTAAGNSFTYSSVISMLGNPAYSGTLVVGKWSRGKFCRLNDTGLVVYENAHDAIVPPEVFDAVQTTLASRKKTHQRSDAGKYLLSGLLRCVHCGNRMYGVDRKRANRPNRQVFYHCANAPEHPKYDQSCPHPAVRQDRLEAFVIDKIRSHLIKTNAAERIQEAITRAKNRETIQSPSDDRKLAALRAKIERATENLALADRDNFEGISRLIAQWRDEESMLLERMEKLSCELDPLPEAIDVIERLGELLKELDVADRVMLANAIGRTVMSISIGRRTTTTGVIKHAELFGELVIHESLAGKPMEIPDDAIGCRKIWREIGQLVHDAKRPLHLADFCAHIGTPDPSHAAYHVRRAEKAGLIKKVGHKGGWVASEQLKTTQVSTSRTARMELWHSRHSGAIPPPVRLWNSLSSTQLRQTLHSLTSCGM